MSDDDKEPYAIGRGKPPREHQFRKGQSGNPRGRPKGSKNLPARIKAAAEAKVTVTHENGRRAEISKLDAAITQAFNKAAKGDLAAIKFALDVAERAQAALEAQKPSADPAERRERDRALIEAFRKQLGQDDDDAGAN